MIEKDHRKAPRTASQLAVDLYDPKGRAVTAEGRFVNVSTHGAMIESAHALKVQEKLLVRFQPGKSPVLDLAAKVIWAVKKRRGFLYGLRFQKYFATN